MIYGQGDCPHEWCGHHKATHESKTKELQDKLEQTQSLLRLALSKDPGHPLNPLLPRVKKDGIQFGDVEVSHDLITAGRDPGFVLKYKNWLVRFKVALGYDKGN